MNKSEESEKALEYLGRNRLMTVATSVDDKVWAATVFFAFDSEFNLLFFSRPDTLHVQNIVTNPSVAGTINQEWGEPGFTRGVQFSGVAEQVSVVEHAKNYAIFQGRFKWAQRFSADHRLYIIRPNQLWYLDAKLFGHENRVQII